MCFSSSPQAATPAAPAPPAPAPLAEAVTPMYAQQKETQAQPGYNSAGQAQLYRDPSLNTQGSTAGLGGASTASAGLGTM